ncbi:uncharacterized protein LOC110460146 [Mizuhopecten yessoensis]|uniref:uncharacterized protein LOC110460146 n=1 Tax=Mizuhopecten yessoensis TaxID=6573 RepID=UPI000B4574F0|nr:uncharacterized protein LOC110460146 [Mizuhopecten yessoensis]
MELEKVLKKYDYVHATEDTEEALIDILFRNRSDFEDAGNLQNIRKCVAVLQEKICVKGYPVDGTPGYDMAFRSLEVIKDVMNDCVDNRRVKMEDCQKMLFDFLLASIRTGPGSTHMELIPKILNIQDLKECIQEMKGNDLTKIMSALKDVSHTSEEPKVPVADQASAWDDRICEILDMLSGNDNVNKPDFQDQLLDLYMFYYLRMTDLPVEYNMALKRVMFKIQEFYRDNYDTNPYKALKNKDILQKHMKTLQGVIVNDKFGRSEHQLDMTNNIMKLLLGSIRDNVKEFIDIWDAVLDFMKNLTLSKKSAEFPKIMEPFGWYFLDEMPENYFKEHPQVVDKWATVFSEILLKGPSAKSLESWAYRMADTVQERAVLKKESAVVWFPIVKGFLRCGQKDSAQIAVKILEEGKFKRIWTWKKNYQEASEMIEIISKVDFPTDGNENDRQLMKSYGDCIRTLLDQLTMAKVADKAVGSVAKFVVNIMAMRSEALNEFVEGFADSISLQSNHEVIPEVIKKFSTIYMDADYPWDDRDTQRCGQTIIDSVINAYKSGKDMPDDVVDTLVQMMLYTMETEDLDYTDVVHGTITIYGCTATSSLITFLNKHMGSDSPERVLGPMMPAIVKQLSHEEEDLRNAARSIMSLMSSQAPTAILPHIEALIQWYKTTSAVDALSAIWQPYKKGDGISKEDFDDLIKAMNGDRDTDHGAMQSVMLMEMGEKQPEQFTQEHVDMMLTERFVDNNDNQYRILLALGGAIQKQPQFFGKNALDHVLRNPKLNVTFITAIQPIGVSLAHHHPELVEDVLTEFVNLSKKCDNPLYQFPLVDSIHTIGTQHGIERLKPHRPYIEELQSKATTATVKDKATSILNEMDGISVEGIVKDVEHQKGDINVLNTKVTETTAKVDVVDKKVDKQEKEIVTVKTGLKATNKRVDTVEKDLDETKIKVEKVDNKTMTNAPKWSRDLTKLMNPQSDHDWRLLAKRLAYTPDDIKGWATQHDPCMGLLSEWYATHKTIEATHAVLVALQEIDRMDGAAIVENAMKAVEGVVEEEVDYTTPPPIFLSYQWGHQNEVKLLRNHLQMAGYECWMDIGQMGGGDKLFEKIDNGIRGAKIIICCVSEKYSKSPNCNREVNLSVSLGKPMIPLLMEKMAWPPKGSMGPIFSEYLFVRFFQRGGEETKDQRFWPAPKFQELLMQLNMYKAMPDESLITKEYKDWWMPVAEEIVITKKKEDGGQSSSGKTESKQGEEELSPDVFLSYQWGKQKQIKQLYRRLNELGYSCWMDIYQMGGGDSLYDKIDRGVRGCKVVLSCVTSKYALSANCRREVSLADSLKKPMVPLLLEKIDWPPTGPMSMVFTQLLFINFYRDEALQMSWNGDKFDELRGKIREYIPALSSDDHPTAVTGPEKSPTKSSNVGQKTPKEEEKPANQAKKPASPQKETKPADKAEKPAEAKEEPKPAEKPKTQPAPKEESKPADKKSSACVLL